MGFLDKITHTRMHTHVHYCGKNFRHTHTQLNWRWVRNQTQLERTEQEPNQSQT